MSLQNRLDDGFSTKLAFSAFPTVEFYEKDVKMPGWDGGEPIETTTMRNITYRTFSPRALKTLTPLTITAAYTSDFFNNSMALALVNTNQEVTVTLPDLSTFKFWAFVRSIEPSSNVEGQQPTVSLTIQPSMTNTTKVETPPTFTPRP